MRSPVSAVLSALVVAVPALAACDNPSGPVDQCTRVPRLEVVPESVFVEVGGDTTKFTAVPSVEPPELRRIWWESRSPRNASIVDTVGETALVSGGDSATIVATAMLPPGCPGSVVLISDSAFVDFGPYRAPSLTIAPQRARAVR